MFSSCKSSKNTLSNDASNIKTIAKGSLYGVGEEGIPQQELLLKNEEQWEALVQKMDASSKVSDTFSERSIDFNQYVLIAVFDKVQSTGGHSIRLEIQESKQVTKALIHKTSPEPGSITTMVLEQPYHILKVPKSEKDVVFAFVKE